MHKMHKNFVRFLKLNYIKLLRSNGTPHKIALAIALGLFVGIAIPYFGQTVIVIILAVIFRTNKILAFAATWVSNPYTVPFYYPVLCYIGSKILGAGLTFNRIQHEILGIVHSFSWHNLFALGFELAASFIVGGIIVGVISGVAGYYIVYKIITRYRNKKSRYISESMSEKLK